MKNKLITDFEQRAFAKQNQGKKKTLPQFRTGDTVRIQYKVQEGSEKGKYRLQPFEGVVVRYRKGTAESTFTVRKIGANGVGVERVFPLNSPFIDGIDVIANGVVRRARLYYLRELSGKAARIKSRFLGGRKAQVVIPGADQLAEAPAADAETEAKTQA